MTSKSFKVTDKDILAMPYALSDHTVARNLGVSVDRVEKVRGGAVATHDGRRKLRTDDAPATDYKYIGKEADALLGDQRNFINSAARGCQNLLAAHLAYHKRHNKNSKLPPLAHAGTPSC
jgi:hypothetical protein